MTPTQTGIVITQAILITILIIAILIGIVFDKTTKNSINETTKYYPDAVTNPQEWMDSRYTPPEDNKLHEKLFNWCYNDLITNPKNWGTIGLSTILYHDNSSIKLHVGNGIDNLYFMLPHISANDIPKKWKHKLWDAYEYAVIHKATNS